MLTLATVFLTVLISLLIVFLVLKRNPYLASNRLLAMLSVVTALWTIFNYLAILPGTSEVDRLLWVRAVMFFTAPYGTIIWMLADAFPSGKITFSRTKFWLLIFYSLVTAILATTRYMFAKVNNLGETNFGLVPGWAIAIYAVGFMGFMTAGFATLIKKYKKSVGVSRKQLWFFMTGLIVSFSLLTLTNFVAVLVFGSVQMTSLGPPFTLIFFGFVLYAMARHRFLDITSFVIRGISYSMFVGAVLFLEFFIFYFGSKFLPFSVDPSLLALSGALFIILGFETLQSWSRRLTEKVFKQITYDTEDLLKRLTKIMAAEIELERLIQGMSSTLVSEMGLSFVKIAVGRETEKGYIDLLANKELLVVDELDDVEVRDRLQSEKLALLVKLMVNEELVGVVLVGRKISGEVFFERDLELVTIFAPEAAVAIKNAQSYKEVSEFNKTLEKRVDDRTKELKASQEKELAKAQEVIKLKDEFVFVASHDLATPVSAITGYMSLIRDSKEKLSAETKENLKAIEESTIRLKNLVNDLLQVARGESGTMRIMNKSFVLKPIIESVLKRVDLLAKERKVKIIFGFSVDDGLQIYNDEQKLMEIMENLLTNGIKYSDTKKSSFVSVKVSAKKQELLISVEDNGLGISKEEQKKVFSKFFRSEDGEVRQRPGTGLGLFVSFMLAGKMGGKLNFNSELDKGSTFVLSLPLEKLN